MSAKTRFRGFLLRLLTLAAACGRSRSNGAGGTEDRARPVVEDPDAAALVDRLSALFVMRTITAPSNTSKSSRATMAG